MDALAVPSRQAHSAGCGSIKTELLESRRGFQLLARAARHVPGVDANPIMLTLDG